jgi:urocanate hydratase
MGQEVSPNGNGGGVGIGYSLHAGMVVADGSAEAE